MIMKPLALSVCIVAVFAASESATAQVVGEKRPQIEAVLGRPFKELPVGAGDHHGLCDSCSYAKNGWKYAVDYIGEICSGIVYLKADDSPITTTEMQQLLVRNS